MVKDFRTFNVVLCFMILTWDLSDHQKKRKGYDLIVISSCVSSWQGMVVFVLLPKERKPQLENCLAQTGLWRCAWEIVLIDESCMRDMPTACGTISWQVCVGCLRKETAVSQPLRVWEWESWPSPSLAATLKRVGPAPWLGSTVDLVLVARVWVSRPSSHESGRSASASCLFSIG